MIQHKKETVVVFCVIIFILVTSLIGFFVGKNLERERNTKENNQLVQKYTEKINTLEKEMQAMIQNRGIHIKSSKEKYKKENIGIYSPLLEGKNVSIDQYKYNAEIIIRKEIRIDKNISLVIWEMDVPSKRIQDDLPGFAIFDGYENYALNAYPVSELRKEWTESYKAKNGTDMYYAYHYSPKTIGVVSLDSLHLYFFGYYPAIPRLVRIYNSKIGNFPSSKNDPAVIKAKEELKKVADTLEFGVKDTLK